MPLSGLGDLAPLSALADLATTAPSQTPAPGPGTADTGPSWLTGKFAQITTVGLGLILILVGLFQFRAVREVTGQAARTAAIAA